jgi:hypothetical protein
MLFREPFLVGIREGRVTLAFRRWRRPSVREGGTLLTPAGQLSILTVRTVDETEISENDANRAGYSSQGELLAELRGGRGGIVYRIELGPLREDPRVALRATRLSVDEHRAMRDRLEKMDRRAADGPWTLRTLALIQAHPAVRAGDLCKEAGQTKEDFKVNVRKLKNLGFTESLEVGYRLSDRGESFLTLMTDSTRHNK